LDEVRTDRHRTQTLRRRRHEWMIPSTLPLRLPRRPLHHLLQIRCNSTLEEESFSFSPRRNFPVPPSNPFTWFPGHMLAGLRALAQTITDIDLIVETRDARIPLSSRNPYLEDVCANKRRLVLYNKRDLAGLTRVQEDVRTPLCPALSSVHFCSRRRSEWK
jgi:hypothetical protein